MRLVAQPHAFRHDPVKTSSWMIVSFAHSQYSPNTTKHAGFGDGSRNPHAPGSQNGRTRIGKQEEVFSTAPRQRTDETTMKATRTKRTLHTTIEGATYDTQQRPIV